ncbi:MAG: M28 family peptidase [Planctomycetaceae bacterium]|nr:M28 family peptidase [Planctomycetaceae bacterium]
MKPKLPVRLSSLTISFAGLLVIELLVCWLYRGPRPILDEPLNNDVPADYSQDFSAERAVSIHEELFPPKPHPAGSVENLLVRDRLIELLRQRHWEVEVQTAIVESDAKVVLHNVLAGLPELNSYWKDRRPLVLATHYDSCRTGPGAGDAGGCVAAIIEAARGLVYTDTTFGSNIQRPIYLLFTDGEELGLLGAQQFVKRHPLSARKPIVLNFDARGTSGPVLMHETHAGNRAAIAAWSNELARPRITGSLFTAVYRTMPAGSDFTVFQTAGWQGFNFALIDGAHRYHQPDDTLANLDRRSLQHFGEHALNLARRIATTAADLPQTPGDAAFFDVLGLFVLHYPLSWCLPLSIAVFILLSLANRQSFLARDGVRALVRVGIAGVTVAAASAATGWFLSRLMQDVGLLPRSFMWYGHALSAGLWLVSAAISLGTARGFLRRCSAESVWSMLWLWWTLAGISVATIAPEFSHLLLWPACLAAALSWSRWSVAVRTVCVTLGSAVLLVPVLHLLSIALGPTSGGLLCPAFTLALMPLYSALAFSPVDSSSALT